jgi:hypothetical protein
VGPAASAAAGIARMAATSATLEQIDLTFIETLHKQFIPIVFWI